MRKRDRNMAAELGFSVIESLVESGSKTPLIWAKIWASACVKSTRCGQAEAGLLHRLVRNTINFDLHLTRVELRFHSRPRRTMLAEELGIRFVHRHKIVSVR